MFYEIAPDNCISVVTAALQLNMGSRNSSDTFDI